MEILLGAIVALVTQLLKRFSNKFGSEWSLVVAFLVTLAAVAVYRYTMEHGNEHVLEEIATTLGIAIGAYEVVLKRIPGLGKQS